MIRKTTFEGHQAVELLTDKLRLVAVHDFGPRIAFLGKPGGRNLLLWAPKGKYTYGEWELRGGHRVWIARPMADECEDTYATDNGSCDVVIHDSSVTLTGAENPHNHTRRGVTITLTTDNQVEVDNFCINTGGFLYSGGIWVLTCTVPTPQTRYATPVGDGSQWDTMTMVYFKRWQNHGQVGYNDPQIQMGDDVVLVAPAGKETKRMIQSPSGRLVMSSPEDGLTFAKCADYIPGAQYPMGCNIAYYIGPGNFMVEMETMGPECTLKPGAEMHHKEVWSLLNEAIPLTSGREILARLK